MKLSQRIAFLGALGFGVGVLAGTVLSAVIAALSSGTTVVQVCTPKFVEAMGGNELLAYTVQALAAGLYGIWAMGSSAVYSIEEWGLLKCTLFHYITTMTLYYVLGFFLRWFTLEDKAAILIFFIALTVMYLIIWLVNYISYSVELKKINSGLESIKFASKDEKVE